MILINNCEKERAAATHEHLPQLGNNPSTSIGQVVNPASNTVAPPVVHRVHDPPQHCEKKFSMRAMKKAKIGLPG